MDVVSLLLVAAVSVLGYSLGTLPVAVWVGARHGFDPAALGSGNPGASNSLRVGGRRAGATVLAGDVGKGVVAAWLGGVVGGPDLAMAAGAGAVCGHVYPAQRGFVGGKGVATAAGAVLVVHPGLALAAGVGWVVLLLVTSLPSVATLGTLGGVAGWTLLAMDGRGRAVLLAVLVLIGLRHAANVRRLVAGVEHGVQV